MDRRPPKSKGFFESVYYALVGSVYGFKTEKNFRTYLCICTTFFIINCLCHVSMIQHVVFIVCLGSVFSAEMLNTAIEHIMDFYTPDRAVAEYSLRGEWNTFTGVLSTWDDAGSEDEMILKIWGDDRLLFAVGGYSRSDAPLPFSLVSSFQTPWT